MKQIFKYLKPYAFRMSIGLAIKFTGTIVELALPWILSYMIDEIIPLKQVQPILIWGGLMLLCSIIAVAFNIIANRMASKVARDTTERVRNDLFSKIIYLSNNQVDYFTLPSLISRVTSDTYNIHQMLGMMQRIGVRAPILLIGGIIITFTLDPILTLVMISVMPIIFLAVTYVSKVGIPMYSIVQKKIDDFVRVVREDVTGIRVIKALSKEDYEREKFDYRNKAAVEQEKKTGMVMAVLNPVMNLCLNLGTVLVILAGAYRVNSGAIKPGIIVAFLTYVTLILNALLFISRVFTNYSKASASAKRINEILNAEEELVIKDIPKTDNGYAIEFDNVSFSYNHKENNLTNISFRIKKGETLGIIGATGSGKSTIVKLLMRFYDVNQGAIKINGQDVRAIDMKVLREKFGVVFQNDFISTDTIFENIRFGRDISEAKIKAAAEYAMATEFIEGKTEGFQTKVAVRGADLSGGQKQRLLISRALAAYPEILILDDSSSALDYKTDASLRKELQNHFKETTTIMIAQRISSIMSADHICVLEDGEIVGYGTHQELIESCDIYREISESQLEE
ncbi:ABC transporter family protein [Clostridium argentinense CDC 2741]|uniref:ABC transporter family protein n=1 Tax=Clostridium argentinense CDC 2741 TaxID=1418104 RepID=A0A0C1U6A3_9CLOT|nr:ABC transporter ATP-binding protein [Clostridium argentinense]ARC84835.1 ABC transporter [Clostridium argentinense]KIE48244.1 ABC transporter family protein [Clostridium argentinense CDC 2741]NFF41154.1 ABC transporter ATP-binding protein [Clostridium argentinense]NFP51592.1 ABC transporter ATP-binding protein [Clostridium argentinense]NFP74043.1 ABC transporter ATP-binding protein [Clostridium argentinense]